MLSTRVIPCLLLKNGGVVKTTKFKNPRYIGDPINTVRIFNEKEVDELVILDIDASILNLAPNLPLLREISSEAFMPLAYGGGIKTLDHMHQIFNLGFEKIIINSLIFENPSIVKEAVKRFGAQSIVCSLDVKRSFFGMPKIFRYQRGQTTSMHVLDAIEEVVKLGVGEIILNSIDRDGTLLGYDLDLINIATRNTQIPLVALGGAGNLSHLLQAVENGASAVAAGSLFIFHGKHQAVLISYPHKSELDHLFKSKETNNG